MRLSERLAERMTTYRRTYTPDPKQGLRFVPDGQGGGTLMRWVVVQRPGFRPRPGWQIVRRVVPFQEARLAA